MLGKLVPCGGGQPIPLLKPKLVVGRHDSCDIPLHAIIVSARHCELELRDGYWFVRDLGSSNGTRVNGARFTEQWLLPDDNLTVAAFRFTVVYAPPAGRSPPPRVGPTGATAAPASPKAASPRETAKPLSASALASGSGLLGELLPCGGGNPIPLHKPRLIVGRHPENDIVLRVSVVSGRHCELELKDGYWHVRDLGSRHGTRVDGVACESKVLMPGNVLWIANQRFKVAYAPPGGSPPATRSSMFARSLLEAAGLARWEPPEPPAGRRKTDDDPHRERHKIDDI
jgi:adenylate cyclase